MNELVKFEAGFEFEFEFEVDGNGNPIEGLRVAIQIQNGIQGMEDQSEMPATIRVSS